MAKNAQDSNESLNANGSDAASEANPYINEDAATGSRFGWIKTKPAKIAAISVGGALALGAVFAGGAFAGQVASHNDGPSVGAPFDGNQFGKHAPRPPHDFDGDGPNGAEPDDEGDDTQAPSGLQSN